MAARGDARTAICTGCFIQLSDTLMPLSSSIRPYRVAVKGERLPLPPVEGEPASDASASDRDAAGPGPSTSSAGALRRSSGGGAGGYYSALPPVPASIRDLIAACFAHSPAARPDMSAVLGVLSATLMEMDMRDAPAAQVASSAGGAALPSGSASAGDAASASVGGAGPSGVASGGGADAGVMLAAGAAPAEADAAQQLATPFFNIGFDFE